jgi:hypothetical protein
MRAILVAALTAILVAEPAIAQPADPDAGAAATQDPNVDGDRANPRSAPPAGPASSLGGSGATGPDSVGILPERFTDFDRKTWQGTPLDRVLQLVGKMPERIDSAAEHELARNLLVSIADAPAQDDGGAKLLAARVHALFSLGDVADAAALARAAPGAPQDEAMAREEVEAELLSGQIEMACVDLRAFSTLLTDPASTNALLLCRQKDGESGVADVPAMDVESLGPAVRIAGAPLPADPATATPARLFAAAQDPKLPPDQRLDAAFAAGRASALMGESLARIFKSAPATEGLAAEGGPPANGPAAAALFHAIEAEGTTETKLALAERGLLSPEAVVDKVSVAMATPLLDLQPVPELGPLAPRFTALFYTLGDDDAAGPWAELADQSGGNTALWPYLVLLKHADPVGIADWEQEAKLDGPRLARILTILSAFGVTAPPREPAAGDDGPEPSLQDLLAMDQAARDSRVGETVLRALAILGRQGPAHAQPLALRRALSDLDAVHLHGEARTLAFEAITATLFEAGHGAGP